MHFWIPCRPKRFTRAISFSFGYHLSVYGSRDAGDGTRTEHGQSRALIPPLCLPVVEELEAAPGVEPGNRGFADLRLNHLATPPAANSDSSEGQPFDQGGLLDESAGPVYGGESLP